MDAAAVRVDPRAPRIQVGRDPVSLFHDPHLAVIWKPSGLLSVAAPGRRDSHVLAAVARWFGSSYPVHRLDEETSGLMMVALTEKCQTALKAAFEAHEVQRQYLAMVRAGFPMEKTVSTTLVRDRGDGKRGSGPDGKPATTHFRRLEEWRGGTLVRATLETGRTHQVRIHLSEGGFPIWGDELYGGRQAMRYAPRLALHAFRLAFRHPVTGKPMAFASPLADDLERLRRDRGGHPDFSLDNGG